MAEAAHRHGRFVTRGPAFALAVDGREVLAHEGETILTALLAAGYRALRRRPDGSPAGAYCAMGGCFECVVTVDGVANVRSCLTPATPGCRVETDCPEGCR